jgi:hypothetical protein
MLVTYVAELRLARSFVHNGDCINSVACPESLVRTTEQSLSSPCKSTLVSNAKQGGDRTKFHTVIFHLCMLHKTG